MENNTMIEIKNLSKKFGGLLAVEDFSGEVKKDQIIGIIGPNGAGKTTILNMISGIYSPTSGTIQFKYQNITGMKPYQINHLGIARTYQNINLFKEMTVIETIKSAYSWRADYSIFGAMVSWPTVWKFEKSIRDKSMHWLEKVGLAEQADQIAQSLPYGMQRRVEIARALATEPQVLLLDEPGAGINHTEIQDLVDLISSLHQELGLAIILIDHRMDVIMKLCDWIYVQDFGKSIAQGTPEQIQNDPVVIKAYLGEEDIDA
jgi:branched-chain amino acid transport system ATP-binding protein